MKKIFYIFLLLFLISHTIYSFFQYSNISLDGDMADIIVPSHWYQQVLKDPFGFSVLLNNEIYCAPNRFFGHWGFSEYFKNAPALIQMFTNPVDSVYVSVALIKILIQILLIGILAKFISNRKKIFSFQFILAASIVAPFFIAYQYYRLGIFSDSITVSFFYPLPFALFLIFLLPVYDRCFYEGNYKFNFIKFAWLVFIIIVVCFSGPIMPGAVFVTCSVFLGYLILTGYKSIEGNSFFKKLKVSFFKINKNISYLLILAILVSIYSLYIGRNNLENTTVETSIVFRYSLLLEGIIGLYDSMPLFLLLITAVILNAVLIKKFFNTPEANRLLAFVKLTVIISIIYILLLPFGGYRTYRPVIIRFDTLLPVTLYMILSFGIMTFFILKISKNKMKIVFSAMILFLLLYYCIQNKPIRGENACERNALFEIMNSKENPVQVSGHCNVVSWQLITDPKDSELNSELLKIWNITKEKKLYYQK